MAKHGIRADRSAERPKAVIQAEASPYDRTHPVGSAERFLDQAAKEALVAAAARGVPRLRSFVPGALRAAAREAERKYPDPLLSEAAELPGAELARRAAHAEAYRKAMDAQNGVVRAASTALSPVGNMAINQTGATAHDALTRQDAKGGDTHQDAKGGEAAGPETAVSETPVPEVPQNPGGPRIVINPTTFHNKKDALCVAFNEGFRVWMEANGFEPQSEPTDAQRKFFSDTAYADDEVQLRRTIIARIATFDTSVKDPTDDQLSETASFLGAVLESGWCKNEWERDSVSRLMNAVQSAVGAEPAEPRQEPLEAREAEPLQRHAAMGGGETEDEEKFAKQDSGQSDQVDQAEEQNLAEPEAQQPEAQQPEAQQPEAQQPEAQQPEAQQPEAQQPEAQQPEAQQPEAQQPEAQQPEAQQPEAQQPEGQDDGRLRAGIDRSQFGKDGHIGIGARIVDPETGKSRSSLSMNGPAIKPARAIGDMGSRSLTDTKSMNGPSIQSNRAIGDMGSTELTDPASMNGPSIQPVQQIGDMGSRSLADSKSMNGPALTPRRRIGDMGGRTLANNRRRR